MLNLDTLLVMSLGADEPNKLIASFDLVIYSSSLKIGLYLDNAKVWNWLRPFTNRLEILACESPSKT
jgi:hypothetical protein